MHIEAHESSSYNILYQLIFASVNQVMVQIMACWLFSTKPLSKPTLGYCQLEPYKQTTVNFSLQWPHNEHDGISNHQPQDSLLKHLFRRRSKKTLKLGITGLCQGYSPVPGDLPAQRASNAENVSIWWLHVIKIQNFSFMKMRLKMSSARMAAILSRGRWVNWV